MKLSKKQITIYEKEMTLLLDHNNSLINALLLCREDKKINIIFDKFQTWKQYENVDHKRKINNELTKIFITIATENLKCLQPCMNIFLEKVELLLNIDIKTIDRRHFYKSIQNKLCYGKKTNSIEHHGFSKNDVQLVKQLAASKSIACLIKIFCIPDFKLSSNINRLSNFIKIRACLDNTEINDVYKGITIYESYCSRNTINLTNSGEISPISLYYICKKISKNNVIFKNNVFQDTCFINYTVNNLYGLYFSETLVEESENFKDILIMFCKIHLLIKNIPLTGGWNILYQFICLLSNIPEKAILKKNRKYISGKVKDFANSILDEYDLSGTFL